MTIHRIRMLGDPILRAQCEPISKPGSTAVRVIIDDLRETLCDFQSRFGYGRGIAAPQIGAPVRIALRPDNVQFEPTGEGGNRFTARVLAQRYQGVQTLYELGLFNSRIEVLEVGSAARHAVGSDVTVALPPETCWAYPSG